MELARTRASFQVTFCPPGAPGAVSDTVLMTPMQEAADCGARRSRACTEAAWEVHTEESGEHAAALIQRGFSAEQYWR